MIDEPTYNGCANEPIRTRSRSPRVTCSGGRPPTREPSPDDRPPAARRDRRGVGAPARTPPRRHEARARRESARRVQPRVTQAVVAQRTTRSGQSAFDRRQHLVHLDVAQAHRLAAGSGADDGTGRRRRARPSRRRATTDRCATGASDRRCRRWACRRPRRCAPAPCRRDITARRRGRGRRCRRLTSAATASRRRATRHDSSSQRLLARPPKHDRASDHASRSAPATAANRSGGQRLFGHAAPGLSTAYRPPVPPRRSARTAESTLSIGNSGCVARMPSGSSSPRLIRTTCAFRPACTCRRRPGSCTRCRTAARGARARSATRTR